MGADGALGRVLLQLPRLRPPALLSLQGSVVCHLLGLASGSRPCLLAPELHCSGVDNWVSESGGVGKDWQGDPWEPGLPCHPFRILPHLRCEDPCPTGTFGEDCGSTCPTCVQGACDAVTGECVCNAGYWGPR